MNKMNELDPDFRVIWQAYCDMKEEVQRLEQLLADLGFCPKDGDPMPCLTCGAGL